MRCNFTKFDDPMLFLPECSQYCILHNKCISILFDSIFFFQISHTFLCRNQVQEAEAQSQMYQSQALDLKEKLASISKENTDEYSTGRGSEREVETLREQLKNTQQLLEQSEHQKRIIEDEIRDVGDRRETMQHWEQQVRFFPLISRFFARLNLLNFSICFHIFTMSECLYLHIWKCCTMLCFGVTFPCRQGDTQLHIFHFIYFAQISEIIHWVSDEKDARGYLQALASKMTEELEALKMSGVPSAEKTWKNRRSQRLDKMELLNLQSSLQSEIQAKQQVQEQLSKSKADHLITEKELKKAQEKLEEQEKEIACLKNDMKTLREQVNGTMTERPDSQNSFYRCVLFGVRVPTFQPMG